MIRLARRPPVRDPQAGVSFRPWMLAHAGSITEIAAHRIERLDDDSGPRRRGLFPWILLVAGLTAAFFLGTSWSASPRLAGDACVFGAAEPAHRHALR